MVKSVSINPDAGNDEEAVTDEDSNSCSCNAGESSRPLSGMGSFIVCCCALLLARRYRLVGLLTNRAAKLSEHILKHL